MHRGTSFPPVTGSSEKQTNQHAGKQRRGIYAGPGVLYSRSAGVSLTDYFLERRVTNEPSEGRPLDAPLPLSW